MAERAKELIEGVLDRAIAEVRSRRVDVFTFAFYHDHESGAVSVCVDTEASSAAFVVGSNRMWRDMFDEAVNAAQLKRATLTRANLGRNMSLGDFDLVNVARTSLGDVAVDDSFYLAVIQATRERESEIASLTLNPERLVFCASSAKAEVGFTWAARS